MLPDPGQIAVFIPIVALMIPITAIITSHLQKVADIKARAGASISAEVRAELNAIKEELQNLRDTTTKFDMAFDGALDRMEQRMDAAQMPAVHTAEYPTPRRDMSAETTPQQVTLGRKGDF